MIEITIAPPVKLKPTSLSKLSAFISFDYDNRLVAFMKELGTRVYLPETKQWEVPDSALPNIIDRLKAYDIT